MREAAVERAPDAIAEAVAEHADPDRSAGLQGVQQERARDRGAVGGGGAGHDHGRRLAPDRGRNRGGRGPRGGSGLVRSGGGRPGGGLVRGGGGLRTEGVADRGAQADPDHQHTAPVGETGGAPAPLSRAGRRPADRKHDGETADRHGPRSRSTGDHPQEAGGP